MRLERACGADLVVSDLVEENCFSNCEYKQCNCRFGKDEAKQAGEICCWLILLCTGSNFQLCSSLKAADFGHTIIVFAHFIQTHGEEGVKSKDLKVTVILLPAGIHIKLL